MSKPWFAAVGATLVAAGVAPPALLGQQPQDSIQLKEIVITATRLPTSLAAVAATTTVISGEELRERGIQFVADALRDVPGAAVVQSGSFGGVTSLFLRGGESDYVKVLVDGVPVNEPGGAFNFANLTTDNVERIEVVRGPVSVLYGADAVSGVVQIFTRGGAGKPSLRGSLEAGTFGTLNWDTGFSGGSPNVDYSLSLSRFSSDGIYAFNNDYRNTVASGRVRALPDTLTDATLTVRYSDNQFNFPTDFAGTPSDSNQFNFEDAFTIGIDAGRRLSPTVEARIALAAHNSDGGFDDRPDNPGDNTGFAFQSVRFSKSLRRSVDGRINWRLSPSVTVTPGSQLEYEDAETFESTTSDFGGGPTTSPDEPPAPADRRTLGYYAQAVAQLPSGAALNLNARLDDSDAFETFFSYRAGGSYLFPSGTRARASLGRGFRAPTFSELFANSAFEVGNRDLKPEHTVSWEIGLEQRLLDGRLLLVGTYFDQRFSDLIQFLSAAPGQPNYQNVSEATARGYELGADLSASEGISATFAYTHLHTNVTDDGGNPSFTFEEGERLLRRPNHLMRVGVRYHVRHNSSVSLNLNYSASRSDVDFNTFPAVRVDLPSYAIVDLAAQVAVLDARGGTPGVSVTARVENLFDEHYTPAFGFRARGRAVFAGGAFQF